MLLFLSAKKGLYFVCTFTKLKRAWRLYQFQIYNILIYLSNKLETVSIGTMLIYETYQILQMLTLSAHQKVMATGAMLL